VITKRLMYIHVFRTGGFMVQGVLRKVPGLVMVSDRPTEHLTYRQMTKGCVQQRMANPPAMVFVRNPFDWYVSMWCWVNMAANMPPAPNFPEYLKAVGEARFGATGAGRNYSKLTDHWRDMGADAATWTGRFEHLEEDFIVIMLEAMPDLVDEEMLIGLMAKEPIHHPSKHPKTGKHPGAYQQYYDAGTQALVEEWDGELLKRFGYSFEGRMEREDIPRPGA